MAKPSDSATAKTIEHCRNLGFVVAELSGGVVVEISSWPAFKKSLPATGASATVKAFHVVTDYFAKRSGKPKRYAARWKVWHTGTNGIDGYCADSSTLQRELSKPCFEAPPDGETAMDHVQTKTGSIQERLERPGSIAPGNSRGQRVKLYTSDRSRQKLSTPMKKGTRWVIVDTETDGLYEPLHFLKLSHISDQDAWPLDNGRVLPCSFAPAPPALR